MKPILEVSKCLNIIKSPAERKAGLVMFKENKFPWYLQERLLQPLEVRTKKGQFQITTKRLDGTQRWSYFSSNFTHCLPIILKDIRCNFFRIVPGWEDYRPADKLPEGVPSDTITQDSKSQAPTPSARPFS